MIIGLMGISGAGKSLAVELLEESFVFYETAFADQLKGIASRLTGVGVSRFQFQEFKNSPQEKLNGLTPKQCLDKISDVINSPEFFTSIGLTERPAIAFMRHELETQNQFFNDSMIIISDVRTKDEVELVKEFGGKLIGIIGRGKVKSSYESETLDLIESHADTVIHNFPDTSIEVFEIALNGIVNYLQKGTS